MAPFRNFLSRKSTAPNGGEVSAAPNDNSASHASLDTHGSSPLNFRKSSENEPPEYKLSGMPPGTLSMDP
ncbi:similar to An08g02380 [Aspergillus luchuensis]|uniref:Similar to An08g02380 n=1 Tax=Aspergillus kawachii TaxID=1069201 RepID=A0A146FUA3_ASPKA|nr:similar to An08g02380 [Aspergillus luchuensis]